MVEVEEGQYRVTSLNPEGRQGFLEGQPYPGSLELSLTDPGEWVRNSITNPLPENK